MAIKKVWTEDFGVGVEFEDGSKQFFTMTDLLHMAEKMELGKLVDLYQEIDHTLDSRLGDSNEQEILSRRIPEGGGKDEQEVQQVDERVITEKDEQIIATFERNDEWKLHQHTDGSIELERDGTENITWSVSIEPDNPKDIVLDVYQYHRGSSTNFIAWVPVDVIERFIRVAREKNGE